MSDEVVIFEAPKVVKPEFRLYYDEKGSVLFYTTEKPKGTFIVIDAQTYAECRHDIRVVNGEIVRNFQVVLVEKLVVDKEGTPCHYEDVSIIVDNDFIEKTYWSVKVYEFS